MEGVPSSRTDGRMAADPFRTCSQISQQGGIDMKKFAKSAMTGALLAVFAAGAMAAVLPKASAAAHKS